MLLAKSGSVLLTGLSMLDLSDQAVLETVARVKPKKNDTKEEK